MYLFLLNNSYQTANASRGWGAQFGRLPPADCAISWGLYSLPGVLHAVGTQCALPVCPLCHLRVPATQVESREGVQALDTHRLRWNCWWYSCSHYHAHGRLQDGSQHSGQFKPPLSLPCLFLIFLKQTIGTISQYLRSLDRNVDC